ncbi:MAG: IS4 family transposase, partial [Burkholderiales bacterium]|nr:IS4 family transposase [Burkholderiales bacterium]
MKKAAISSLRIRIGAQPLADLVRRCCVPLADAAIHPGAFYRGLRLVGIDGSTFELADETDNDEAFGRRGGRQGPAGYPQARCALLAECATHAILAANLGPYRCGEWELCVPLLASLGPGMLCLADRGFNGFEHGSQASATGAQLLWRCASTRKLPVERRLSDGSYSSTIGPTGVSQAQAQAQARAITVRVIDYKCPKPPDAEPHYRLITTLLDERAAPAMELAELYHRRWEMEALYDELETHLRQCRRVLRSKTAELVRQEFYGWVLTHYAVRWLLHHGAARHHIPHEDLSFMGALQLLRREQPHSGAFSPGPQGGREDARVGSIACWPWSPRCARSERSTGDPRAWSSEGTRATRHWPGARRGAYPSTGHQRRLAPCGLPRRAARARSSRSARGRRATPSVDSLSKQTVLPPDAALNRTR